MDDSEDEEELEPVSCIPPEIRSVPAGEHVGSFVPEVTDSKFSPDPVKVAGNISREEFRSFWVNDLKADIWTMNLIREGYKLPFSKEPGQYQERNNKSARSEKPYLIESVSSLRDRGVVKKLNCSCLLYTSDAADE